MKNLTRFTALGVSSVALLTAGCKSDAKTALSLTDSIEDQKETLIKEFTSLSKQEKDLQTLFEKTLEEDEKFDTLKDGSSPVFENIQFRHDILEKIDEVRGNFEKESESLSKLEAKDLPEDQKSGLATSLSELSSQLKDFQKFYGDSLMQQKDYFESLPEEKATYETFTEGITGVNEKQKESNQKSAQIEKSLKELDDANQKLRKTLDDLLNKK